MAAKVVELAACMGGGELLEHETSEQIRERPHGQKEALRQAIQRAPSFDNPPLGTIICTSG